MRRGKLIHAAVLAGLSSVVGLSAHAEIDNTWVGGNNANDWNTGSNWALGHAPTRVGADNDGGTAGDNEDALINTAPAAVISAGVNEPSQRDLFVGRGAGGTGVVNHTAGTLANQNGNWMYIGTNGGTGTYNLANTAGTGGQFTGFAPGSGTLTSTGRIYVGGKHDDNNGGTGTLNINTTGTVSSGNDFAIGAGSTGTGTVNLDAGAVSVGGWLLVGADHGASGDVRAQHGTINMSGGSIALTDGGARLAIGLNGTTGTVNMTGGTITTPAEMWVSNGKGGLDGHASVGTLAMTAGTVNASNWVAVGRDGGLGVLDLSGTAVFNKTGSGNAFIIGSDAAGSNGTVNVSGNAQLLISTDLNIGVNSDTNVGKLVQTGGTVRVAGNLNLTDGANRSGTYSLGGGVLDMTAHNINNGGGIVAFNFTGGTLKNAANINVPVNQTGGTLAPGASPGTTNLTAGFILGIGGSYQAELQSGNSISDLINVTGGNGLTLAGTLNPVAFGGALTPGTVYTIATYSALSGTFSNAPLDDTTYTLGGQLYTVDYNAGGNNITLTVAVPEPATVGLLGLAGAALTLRRRRQA